MNPLVLGLLALLAIMWGLALYATGYDRGRRDAERDLAETLRASRRR